MNTATFEKGSNQKRHFTVTTVDKDLQQEPSLQSEDYNLYAYQLKQKISYYRDLGYELINNLGEKYDKYFNIPVVLIKWNEKGETKALEISHEVFPTGDGENNIEKFIYLRKSKANLMENAETRPSYIIVYKSGKTECAYQWPRGRSWSQGLCFFEVEIVDQQ